MRETTAPDTLLQRATELAEGGARARAAGDEATADSSFRQAVALVQEAMESAGDFAPAATLLALGARCALECGEVALARAWIEARPELPDEAEHETWEQLGNTEAWPDGWLVAAVRLDPPDEATLETLVRRHWRVLFARCHLLALHRERAADLAQETWCRILRSRHKLRPGGNFRAYLLQIATNLWRDAQRSALRAGPLADNRLESFDRERTSPLGDKRSLAEILPDADALDRAEGAHRQAEIEHALARLEPRLRDVLLSRYLGGESCAEIGRRYNRTEQTISGWIRRGIQEIRLYLQETR
ncbi:MAG TPA: sigma-70 family RNA polymerase sigma factor [Opitutaceae bacterium]